MRKIAIIIVNWNGKVDTAVCLSSINKLVIPKDIIIKTFVVDNGSTDESVPELRIRFPWVEYISLDTNLGFTGGNNKGIKNALLWGADFVWLINNDTILDKAALKLLNGFSSKDVGIAGSKIYFAAGHEYHKRRYRTDEEGKVLWYAGGFMDWNNIYASHRGVDQVDSGQFDEMGDTPFVTGCSMMIKRSVIDRIGFLDSKFYLYLEDLDYCLRAKKAGFRLLYVPESVLWHVNAGSSGGAGNPLHGYYMTRNRMLIGLKYATLRTKIALFRESVRLLFYGTPQEKIAIRDFFLWRWGNQYEPKKINN